MMERQQQAQGKALHPTVISPFRGLMPTRMDRALTFAATRAAPTPTRARGGWPGLSAR